MASYMQSRSLGVGTESVKSCAFRERCLGINCSVQQRHSTNEANPDGAIKANSRAVP